MKRNCAICGEQLSIIVNDDKSYSGGHYFDLNELGAEYWECDACYKEWPK